jgi:hypothetical protein
MSGGICPDHSEHVDGFISRSREISSSIITIYINNLNYKSRSLGSFHSPFHFHLVSSQLPPEGAVLEGCEERVHLRQRGAVRCFQFVDGGDSAGEFVLEGERGDGDTQSA